MTDWYRPGLLCGVTYLVVTHLYGYSEGLYVLALSVGAVATAFAIDYTLGKIHSVAKQVVGALQR